VYGCPMASSQTTLRRKTSGGATVDAVDRCDEMIKKLNIQAERCLLHLRGLTYVHCSAVASNYQVASRSIVYIATTSKYYINIRLQLQAGKISY
jgi:hypothetical protein